jgi:hypothetical protein
MDPLLAVCIIVVAVAVVVTCATWLSQRSTSAGSASLVKKTMIVNTKDGQSVRGVLIRQHSDRLTLDNALYLQENGRETAIDGLTHIPISNVSWVQEISLPSGT